MFIFAVSYSSVEQCYIDMLIGHFLNILVFKIKGNWPEYKVCMCNDVEKFFMYVEHGNTASTAGCAPIDGQLQFWLVIRSHLFPPYLSMVSTTSFIVEGPSCLICSVISLTTSCSFLPSLALIHSRRRRFFSIPIWSRYFWSSLKRRRHL